MNEPMTGPAWYWIAGTTALVLWAWVLVSVPAVLLPGRWLRASQRAAEDQAIAVTRPPARATPPPTPGRGRLVTVVKTWECRCQEVWRGPGDILHFPCSAHMDAEIKGLSR